MLCLPQRRLAHQNQRPTSNPLFKDLLLRRPIRIKTLDGTGVLN